MKYKLNNLDINVLVKELNKNLLNLRLNNIYDMNDKQYLFKFDIKEKNDIQQQLLFNNKLYLNYNHGKYLFLDSKPNEERKILPNSVCYKMKEAIKNKRITKVFQPNNDKIIVLGFGFNETTHYLIMEFFSSGNMILTDNEYNIITLIRIHDYDDNNKVRVRNKYIFPECNKEIPEYTNYKIINNEIFFDDNGVDNILIFMNDYLHTIKEEKVDKVDKRNIKDTKYEKSIKNINNKILNLENQNNKTLINNQFIEENLYELEQIYNKFIENINDLYSLKIDNYEFISFEEKNEKVKKNYVNKKIIKFKYFDINLTFDLNFSLFENLGNYYKNIKNNNYKLERTKYGKENIIKDYENKSFTKQINNIRKENIIIKTDYWFQKFHWAFSNNKFLIIAGKNADQNEEIVKKYLEPNDIYLHAEIGGMPSTIIKNLRKYENDTNLFIKVLEDANHLAILKSRCWNDKYAGRCYWVYPEQVSQTTESGEYISKGSFIIRGKRNSLSVVSMEIAFGIYFIIKNKENNIEDMCVLEDKNIKEIDKYEIKSALLNVSSYRNLKNNPFCVKMKYGNGKRNKIFKQIMDNNYKKYNNNELLKDFLKSINMNNSDILPTNVIIS
jgi:predicted ribosome quality control (RQC) complex YloA/Tae2 family protein